MRIPQYKSQVTFDNAGESHEWARFEDQRVTSVTPDTTEALSIPNMVKSAAAPPTMQMSHLNEMPPGYDAARDNGSVDGPWSMSVAGASDVTDHVTAQTMRDGFFSAPLSQEEYSNDRDGGFDDDVGGMVNRNNYLDRL